MKLRNKKTGEIKEIIVGGYPVSGKTKMWECSEIDANEETGYKTLGTYTSLAELNEGWEDYEEPEEVWYIDCKGDVRVADGITNDWSKEKQIGNYFETREEAEKAVEKLKAWKRLKDNGLLIKKWRHTPDMHLTTGSFLKIEGFIPAIMKNIEDLDLLFGGEE